MTTGSAENRVRKCLARCLRRKDVLALAIRQRAKFEGWLKYELAGALTKERSIKGVTLEEAYGTKKRSDLAFSYYSRRYYIELKTCNANWRIEGVADKTRPITKNIASIIEDIQSLRRLSGGHSLMVFTIFPVPRAMRNGHPQLGRFLERIERSASVRLAAGRYVSILASAGIMSFVVPVKPSR